MNVKELALLVQDMRRAQSRYFRDRDLAALDSARKLEREVDAVCERLLSPSPQRDLFDERKEEAP